VILENADIKGNEEMAITFILYICSLYLTFSVIKRL